MVLELVSLVVALNDVATRVDDAPPEYDNAVVCMFQDQEWSVYGAKFGTTGINSDRLLFEYWRRDGTVVRVLSTDYDGDGVDSVSVSIDGRGLEFIEFNRGTDFLSYQLDLDRINRYREVRVPVVDNGIEDKEVTEHDGSEFYVGLYSMLARPVHSNKKESLCPERDLELGRMRVMMDAVGEDEVYIAEADPYRCERVGGLYPGYTGRFVQADYTSASALFLILDSVHESVRAGRTPEEALDIFRDRLDETVGRVVNDYF